MTNPDSDNLHEGETPFPQPRTLLGMIGGIAPLVARVWVVGLLLLGAVFAGVSVNQLWSAEAELKELRTAPGPDAYAVVAYQRELERQIEAYRRDWRSEAVPAPPLRPRLLEEIDLARQRNKDAGQGGGGGGSSGPPAPISAPQ